MSHIKFVVFTSSRTGSTWLVDLLNMQPGVAAHGELFLDQRRSGPAIAKLADFPRFIEMHDTPGLTRVAQVFSYLNKLYRTGRTVGFKLMYAQLRKHPEIFAYLAARRIRIVHLVRRNHLDVIVSEELATLIGSSHAPAGTRSEVPKVYLNPATLAGRLQNRDKRPRQARFLIRCSCCPYLEVAYEDLLEGEREFARILGFLGIRRPAAEVQSNLEKRGTLPHKEAIVNYEEVRQILSATPFSSLLR